MPAAVVNLLTFRDPIEPALFAAVEDELGDQMRSIEGFEGLRVVQTSSQEVVLLIFGTTEAVLDQVATEVGSPWMVANVVPLLAGPPSRHLGPVLASVTP